MAETITSDLCIIGAGPAGLAAAAEARSLGASVVLIERDRIGGDYFNRGAVPSRSLAAAAAHAHAICTGAAFGVTADEPRVNFRRVHDGLLEIVAALAPRRAVAHLEALGIQVLLGEARFLNPRIVGVGDIHVRARRTIIATGARAAIPQIDGLASVPFFTSETIFDNTRKLTHLIVIGGGPLALEIAQSYRRLGTAVTVAAPSAALPDADPELAAVALRRLREEGVDIRENTAVSGIQPRSQGIGVVVRTASHDVMLDVSHILVADGRVPNLDALDLHKAGVRRSAGAPQKLELTRSLKTTNPRIYAIGEAAGVAQHADAAALHARLAVRNALLLEPIRRDALLPPSIVFTDPEIAEVGLSESDARTRYGDRFRVLRASFADNDRGQATRQAYGVMKLIVGRNGRVLGAGVVGDRAGELIAPLTLAIANRLPAARLAQLHAPHATLSRMIAELGREYLRDEAVSPLERRLAALIRFLP